MYISPRLRGGNRFAGEFLDTFAAILVRFQAEREGGDFGLASVNSSARGGPVCRWVSKDVFGDFGSPPSGTGGWGFCFSVFQ